jgi:hypothetical protein
MVPYRAHTNKPASQASTHPAASTQLKTGAQVKNGPSASAAGSATTTTRTSPSTP